MGRKKTIHIILEQINRSGPEVSVVCKVEEPYHLMLVYQDGGGIEKVPREKRAAWFDLVKDLFANIVLDSRVNTPPEEVAVQIYHVSRRIWAKGGWCDTGLEEPPKFSLSLLEVKKEEVASKKGHTVRYFIVGPDIAIIFSNINKIIHDEEAAVMYRQVENMFKAAVRLSAPSEIPRIIERYNENIRQINENYSWWHKRETGEMGITGTLCAADEENTLAVVSKDMLALLADSEIGVQYGCETAGAVFANLYENGGENRFLERLGQLRYPELTPRKPEGELEVVICLPYMRKGLTL